MPIRVGNMNPRILLLYAAALCLQMVAAAGGSGSSSVSQIPFENVGNVLLNSQENLVNNDTNAKHLHSSIMGNNLLNGTQNDSPSNALESKMFGTARKRNFGYNATITSSQLVSGELQVLPVMTSAFRIGQSIFAGRGKDALVNVNESSLTLMLVTIVTKMLRECDLIIVVDEVFQDSSVPQVLSRLQNFKQIVSLYDVKALESAIWTSSSCQGSLFLMTEIASFKTFGENPRLAWNYSGRVIFAGLTKEQLEKLLLGRKVRKTEHVIGLVKSDKVGQYKVYRNELYWKRGSLALVALWRGKDFAGSPDFFPDKISNIRKAPLNVIVFEFPPSIIYRRSANGTLIYRYGWEVAVVEALAKVVNFTIVYVEPTNGEMWGVKLPNGSWDGLVGLLAKDEGDLGVANIFISAISGRLEYQEYSIQFATEETCYLARMEPPLPRWQSLALPFKLNSWIAIIVGLILSGPLLYLLAVASSRCGYENKLLLSPIYSFMYSFGMYFRNPTMFLPIRPTTQIIVVFLWIYTFILTTAYSSNLTAFLTISRQPVSMETFKELYERHYKVFSLGKFFQSSMASSFNKYLNALAERFYQIPLFEDIKPKVLNGEGVMIQSRSYLEYVSVQLTTPKGRPMVRIMKECFAPFGVGLAFQSNSPLKAKFDRVISWMVESGLVGRWFLDSITLSLKYKHLDSAVWKEKRESTDTVAEHAHEQHVIPLGIDHMQGIFLVLAVGCLIGILCFTVEMCLKKYDRN